MNIFCKILKRVWLLVLIGLSACSNHGNQHAKQEIPLQVVRQSSGLIHCAEVFGYSVKKLEEENEILIQTGTIDTSDEQDPSAAAIIKVNNRDVTLYLVSANTDSDRISEEYAGEGYTLSLLYHEAEKENSRISFEGYAMVKNQGLSSEYKLEGMPNIHDY